MPFEQLVRYELAHQLQHKDMSFHYTNNMHHLHPLSNYNIHFVDLVPNHHNYNHLSYDPVQSHHFHKLLNSDIVAGRSVAALPDEQPELVAMVVVDVFLMSDLNNQTYTCKFDLDVADTIQD